MQAAIGIVAESRITLPAAILARVEAKPGKDAAIKAFLKSAFPLANAAPYTSVWFALKMGPSKLGIFNVFPHAEGRTAHLNGQIAAALMANAAELLSQPPSIEMVEVLASKMPGEPAEKQRKSNTAFPCNAHVSWA